MINKSLSYFIQPETDEIRSLANPNFYFHYFRTKNERHNDRQRFAFNQAVQKIVHERLEVLGLVKVPLPSPRSASPQNNPSGNDDSLGRHVPIFLSKDLHKADRVVVLFGEGAQQLGVLAHRVIGGQGGVGEGSVISLVKDILATGAGVILANTGERWWWPDGQRPLCHRDSLGVKMKSCVHKVGSFDPDVNQIPGSEDVAAHVGSVFERILDITRKDEENEGLLASSARIQLVAVGEAAPAVEAYLDENWGRWRDKIACLAMLGDGQPVHELKDSGFKTFLREVSNGQKSVPFPSAAADELCKLTPFFALRKPASTSPPKHPSTRPSPTLRATPTH